MQDRSKLISLLEQHLATPHAQRLLPLRDVPGIDAPAGSVSSPASVPFTRFSELTADRIYDLRLAIAHPEGGPGADIAERILRYAEINSKVIHERIPSGENKVLFCTELISLFLDLYFRNKDLRFLNAAMKLADKSWMTTVKNPSQSFNGTLAQGLGIRAYLLIEHALEQLEHGR